MQVVNLCLEKDNELFWKPILDKNRGLDSLVTSCRPYYGQVAPMFSLLVISTGAVTWTVHLQGEASTRFADGATSLGPGRDVCDPIFRFPSGHPG